jgi:hypothetical protein
MIVWSHPRLFVALDITVWCKLTFSASPPVHSVDVVRVILVDRQAAFGRSPNSLIRQSYALLA